MLAVALRRLPARSESSEAKSSVGKEARGVPSGIARDPGETSFTFRNSLRMMAAPAPGAASYFRNYLTRNANRPIRRVGRVVEGAPLLRV